MITAIKQAWGRLFRGYAAAESNRLTSVRPVNRSADTEAQGPFGADALRAWSRQLVRDNAYAWGVVDTIVSNVVGTGICLESTYQTLDGEDIANVNEGRQRVWKQWCKVADLTGRLSFSEIQRLALREIVEAGECLIHFVTVPLDYKGVRRPIPFALEMIEADRLASDKDTYTISRETGVRIIRGVEIDDDGIPIAYWIYPDHPAGQFSFRRVPERIEAAKIAHLYRQDRIGQTRGVSWFAPVAGVLRDLGLYIENELQSSAIAACDMTLITTETPLQGPRPGDGESTTDDNSNPLEYYEPGRVYNLRPGEGVEHINPSRPNSGAEPWINLMLRGTGVGTGLSYETVARDYSQTSYSSNRASQLEDRRRYRPTQQLLISDLCDRTWRHFCESAALIGLPLFPTSTQLDEDIDMHAPAEWHPPIWEWVDPTSEQAASENSIKAFQATYQAENGKRGQNYLTTFKQRAKEERERRALGLLTVDEKKIETEYLKAQAALLTAQAAMKNASTITESEVANA